MRIVLALCVMALALEFSASAAPTYAGSTARKTCRPAIYAQWQKTPMANIVRDPKVHPDAIIPDFSKADPKNSEVPQGRHCAGVGEPVEAALLHENRRQLLDGARAVGHGERGWRPFFVENNADWWAKLYPPDNMECRLRALRALPRAG